jgi:predicted amidophosphoribosyltransferase
MGGCFRNLKLDALNMLKEQEPMRPIYENYWKHTMGRCGHCKAPLPAIEGMQSKFCWMCGRAVKWDEAD